MKNKNLIAILSMCILFIFNAAFGLAFTKKDNTNFEYSIDSSWMKNHRRVKKLVRDSFTVEIDANYDATGMGSFSVEVNHKWVYVECCKHTTKPYNYCNSALQDKRC